MPADPSSLNNEGTRGAPYNKFRGKAKQLSDDFVGEETGLPDLPVHLPPLQSQSQLSSAVDGTLIGNGNGNGNDGNENDDGNGVENPETTRGGKDKGKRQAARRHVSCKFSLVDFC